jgi:hypothetical protein
MTCTDKKYPDNVNNTSKKDETFFELAYLFDRVPIY